MTDPNRQPGGEFRRRANAGKFFPLIGVYDVFSAKLAAARFDGVFCSGLGFSASAYGLPDVGYANWRDIIDFATRIRHVLPRTHVLVDVDDGFGDEKIAATTVKNLEMNGASAVVLEDQKRPRRCGHYEGKEILPAKEYLFKLDAVLNVREDIFVVARTDAVDAPQGIDRALQYAEAGADAIMVEAIRDLSVIRELRRQIDCPLVVNQLHGGKTPNWSFSEMEDAGASIGIYSTPCLFAAQRAVEGYLDAMRDGGRLPSENTATLEDCTEILEA
jgi:2-methylisocitrate lyase-like PEP mutase family enzyme